MTPTIEELARGLTEAQKRGIIVWKDCYAVGPQSNLLYDFAVANKCGDMSSGLACGCEELPALMSAGILSATRLDDKPKEVEHPEGFTVDLDYVWKLTPLGLTLRAYLEKAQ